MAVEKATQMVLKRDLENSLIELRAVWPLKTLAFRFSVLSMIG
jgi:hypothetical protein